MFIVDFPQFHAWLNGRSRSFWLCLGFALVLCAGWLDYVTGDEINVTIFYLVPIGITAWYAGRRSGSVLAVVSAAIWYLADRLAGHQFSKPHIAAWDTLVSFTFFLLANLAIARLRVHMERERSMAREDFLTGLPNRRGFYELARRELDRCCRHLLPLTVAYIDCDRFKTVNDQWGHQAGDELLILIGQTLKSSLRSTDVAARMGGDEFAVLFPDLKPRHAEEALRGLLEKLRQAVEHKPWDVDFSVGAISLSRVNQDIEEIITRADALMYRAKREDRTSREPRILSGIT